MRKKSDVFSTEAARNICHAIGAYTICLATAYNWYDRFNKGNLSLANLPKPGRPTEVNLDQLKKAIEELPAQTTRELAAKLSCSHSANHYHLKLLGMVHKLG